MPDAQMPNQATEPDQEIAASQQAQAYAPANPGGSAMLDATIAAGEMTAPKVEGADEPIATNFSSGTNKADAKIADVTTRSEAASGEQTDKGMVHLQSSPVNETVEADPNLPDTDAAKLPLDRETNLPE